MARYETGTGNTRRFWEITVTGPTLQTRDGRVGSNGRLRDPKVFASEADALSEAEKRIAGKLRDGFELVDDDIGGLAENPALAEAIKDNPDDDGAYLVYADWLQAQGDKRGRLATLQQQLQQRPDDPGLRREENKLMKTLAPARLARMASKKRNRKRAQSGYSELHWRYGFIDGARIARNSDRPPHTVRELTAALLRHPSARLLRTLIIGPLAMRGENDYGPVIAEICAAAPASLRELFIADFDVAEHADLSSTTLGDVSGLYSALPRLRALHLRAGSLELGAVCAPTLRSLTVTTGLFDERALTAIAAAPWPELAHLRLEASGPALPFAGLSAIGAAPDMAALRHFALINTSELGNVWREILRDSPLLARLQVLDLSHGDLSDDDAQHLLAGRESLKHLRTLDLSGNFLSADVSAALRDLGPEVKLVGQRSPTVSSIALTDQQIVEFAPDGRSLMAARKVARPDKWSALGTLRNRWLGGMCQGSDMYKVYVDVEDMESRCTCPSQKHPCKHAIALLIMAQSHPMPGDLPASFMDEVDFGGDAELW